MNETPQLESKQNSYKQLNPNFETMLKAMVFPFYMRVLQQINNKKKKKQVVKQSQATNHYGSF
jgi:hypothetical protein